MNHLSAEGFLVDGIGTARAMFIISADLYLLVGRPVGYVPTKKVGIVWELT
jgi:hypothetical protein